MAEIRNTVDNTPSPIDITIYQGSGQPIRVYPYGTDTANLPSGWATDYTYTMYVWDPADTSTNLKTIVGTNDGATGLTEFAFSRADRLLLTWTTPKQYEVTETLAAEVIEVPFAGEFVLMLRSGVST